MEYPHQAITMLYFPTHFPVLGFTTFQIHIYTKFSQRVQTRRKTPHNEDYLSKPYWLLQKPTINVYASGHLKMTVSTIIRLSNNQISAIMYPLQFSNPWCCVKAPDNNLTQKHYVWCITSKDIQCSPESLTFYEYFKKTFALLSSCKERLTKGPRGLRTSTQCIFCNVSTDWPFRNLGRKSILRFLSMAYQRRVWSNRQVNKDSTHQSFYFKLSKSKALPRNSQERPQDFLKFQNTSS